MLRALWTAGTGMLAQQLNVDTISNNLANVNTAGFKKSRVEFQDLMYADLRPQNVIPGEFQGNPISLQVGHGVRPTATLKNFTQGNLNPTGNPLDLAIQGEGFFTVILPDGNEAYTRDGSFKLSPVDETGEEARLVTSDGYWVSMIEEGTIPRDAQEISVSADGTVSAKIPGEEASTVIGKLKLARFGNPAGLEAMGQNLFRQTVSSGEPLTNEDETAPVGTVLQGYLEMSNVQVVEEMVNLIVAQRAYEINSKSVQVSDEMLNTANNLRR